MTAPELSVDVVYLELPIARSARVRDLSSGGAFVESDAPMPVGTRLWLRPVGGEPAVALGARVVRVVEAEAQGPPAGMGMAFEALPREALEFLAAWLGPHALAAPAARATADGDDAPAVTAPQIELHPLAPSPAGSSAAAEDPDPALAGPVPAAEMLGDTAADSKPLGATPPVATAGEPNAQPVSAAVADPIADPAAEPHDTLVMAPVLIDDDPAPSPGAGRRRGRRKRTAPAR